MKVNVHISENNQRRWSKSAIDCLNNHCVCGTCPLSDKVYNCMMKEHVLALYKKFGRPNDYIEPTIRED